MVTVGKLRTWLEKLPDDLMVVVPAYYGEGDYSPLIDAGECVYVPVSEIQGACHTGEISTEKEFPCLTLFPTWSIARLNLAKKDAEGEVGC